MITYPIPSGTQQRTFVAGNQHAAGTVLVDAAGTEIAPATQATLASVLAELQAVLAELQGTITVDGSAVTQPISAASLPLPAGAATAANQQTDALTNTQLRATPVPVDGSGATQPVSVASLPLPAGAATAANQQTDALTDTQLRATPVPVAGPLTDAQLRASEVDVNVASVVNVTGGPVTVQPFDDPNETPQPSLSFNATAAGETPVVGMDAPGAGISRRIYHASLHADGASDVRVALRDGSAGTIIWQGRLAASGGGANIDFGPNGRDLTANTALVIDLGTAVSVDLNVTDHSTVT